MDKTFKRCDSCLEELHWVENQEGNGHWQGCDEDCGKKIEQIEEAKKKIREVIDNK